MNRALAVFLVACGAKETKSLTGDDGCLPLPHARRHSLQADPHGDALYWFETVAMRDYDSLDKSFQRLVRYDLATQHATVILEPVLTPLHVTRDGIVVVYQKGDVGSLVEIRDGRVQGLLPDYMDVKDVEPIDATKLAVLVNADAKSSIFLLDLDSPRPVYLIDADVVLSAVRGTVYARDGAESFAVSIASGAREPRDVPSAAMPDGENIYYVEDSTIRMRSLRTNETRKLVDDPRAWTFVHQTGSVLARAYTATEHRAVLLADGVATPLPAIRGGASIVGAVNHREKTWALIGHNTSNFDGDLWTTTHEADVCQLVVSQPSREIVTRTVPGRYEARVTAFWAAAAKYPKTRWQVFEYAGDPPTVTVTFDEPGGTDLDRLRARARELHKSTTSLLADDEVRTSLSFSDGRLAQYRWRRNRLRGRALAGMGDALLTDPADYDVEISDAVDVFEGDKIRCSGKLVNVRTVTLLDVEVRCIAGDLERVIKIPKLEPKQAFNFSQAFNSKDGDNPILEVFRGRSELVVRDMKVEATSRTYYDFFVKLYDETGLALSQHDSQSKFYVHFEAALTAKRADIKDSTMQLVAERLEAGRELLGIEEGAELDMTVFVERASYRWTGETLVAQ